MEHGAFYEVSLTFPSLDSKISSSRSYQSYALLRSGFTPRGTMTTWNDTADLRRVLGWSPERLQILLEGVKRDLYDTRIHAFSEG